MVKGNCEWLFKQKNKSELCKKSKVVQTCLDTYENRCIGQHFIKCINVGVPIHNPTHNPTINSCNDCATETSFMYKNKDNE